MKNSTLHVAAITRRKECGGRARLAVRSMGMRRYFVLLALAACGGGGDVDDGDVTVRATMVLAEQTGVGPSPLDSLLGQTISFEVLLGNAVVTHETVEACRWTVHTSNVPTATATGDTAELVQTGILDKLPAWDARLALCEPASQSSVTLHADFDFIGVIAGCLELPASAQQRDASGEPVWTEFAGARCDGTVYDAWHDRLFTAESVTMQFATAPR